MRYRDAVIRKLVLLALTIGTGCEPRGGRDVQPPEPTGQPPADEASVTERMRAQFVDGAALEDALVTGKGLIAVNEVATRFVERHREEPFPERWEAKVAPLMECAVCHGLNRGS